MIRKRLHEIEDIWDCASNEMYAEIAKVHGEEYMKSAPSSEFYKMIEEWWSKLFLCKLVLTPWEYDKDEMIPYVEFSSNEQFTFFILRYSRSDYEQQAT